MPHSRLANLVFFIPPTNNFYISTRPVCSRLLLCVQPGPNPRTRDTAVPVVDINQPRDLTHQRCLMCFDKRICVDHFPQHFHQVDAFFVGKTILDRPRKAEELDRMFDLVFRRLDQGMRFVMLQFEAVLAQPFDTGTFVVTEFRIGGCGIDQQHSCRQVKFVRGVATCVSAASGFVAFEEGLEAIKHVASYHRNDRPANKSPAGAHRRRVGYCPAMNTPSEKARHFPATARNRDVIADVLKRHLPESGTVLEIGSGSGEHCIYFAGLFPHLVWQPSDPDPLNLASIQAWIDAEVPDAPNIRPPLSINASDVILPIDAADAIFCANVIHISPWDATQGLMRNAGSLLPPGGLLYLYGPYRIDGTHTAPSNEAFDGSLRSQNETWGVRDLEDVCAEAEKNGLAFSARVEMPSNNQSVIFTRAG
jgi:SAM-dependent methyltransferase